MSRKRTIITPRHKETKKFQNSGTIAVTQLIAVGSSIFMAQTCTEETACLVE